MVKTVNVEHFSKINTADEPIVDVAGYAFKEWRIYKDDLSHIVVDIEVYKVTSNIQITADVSISNYIVSLHTNNYSGDVLEETYTIKDDDFDLLVPKKQGYTFEGWFESPNFDGNSVSTIEKGSYGNKSFYAKWKVNTYAITLPSSTTGYSITYSDGLTRDYNSSFEFKIIFEEPYSQSVNTVQVSYLNKGAQKKEQISSVNSTFVVSHVVEDTEIFIENVKLNTYTIKFVLDNEIIKTVNKTYSVT